MTHSRYIMCCKCKQREYAGRNGKIDLDSAQNLAEFLEHHVYDCKGELYVADESYHPEFCFEVFK